MERLRITKPIRLIELFAGGWFPGNGSEKYRGKF